MLVDRILAVVPIHGPDPLGALYYVAGVGAAGVLAGAAILWWVDGPRRRERKSRRRGFMVEMKDK
jgi:hypothetical protein